MSACQPIAARSVPAYAATGQRLRRYSPEAAERYTSLHLCIARRHKRTGRITSIQFRPLPQDCKAVDRGSSCRRNAYAGQRYSYRERLHDSLRAWCFVPFLVGRLAGEEREDVELRLMEIFRAVPLSCLATVPASGSVPSATGAAFVPAAASAAAVPGRLRVTKTPKA